MIFSHIFIAHAYRNGYLWVSGEHFDTGIRFLDPDFLISSPDEFRRLEDVFCWFLRSICWLSTILLLPAYLTYWPTKRVTCFSAHDGNFHPVWSWYDHPLTSYSILAADALPCDLDLWPFDIGQLPYTADYMFNRSSKFGAPTAICSWVMSSDTSTLNMTLTT